MPTFALSTGSLYTYGVARAFDLAAAAGFDAVEVMVDQRWDSRHPHYLRRLSENAGLPVAAVHSPFVPSVPGWPHDPQDRLRQTCALARELGARVVVAHLPLRIRAAKVEFFGFRSGPLLLPLPMPAPGDYAQFLLNGLAQFEASEGVTIGVENMPCKRFLGRRLDIYALNSVANLVDLPHLTLDTTHIGTWGADLLSTYERLKARVVHVHLSDFDGTEHRLPEEGHLPLAEFLQALRHDGYGGAVSLECNPVALEAEDEGRVLAHLREAVRFYHKHTSE
jgi:sugar phosphate isomerase/epimerase